MELRKEIERTLRMKHHELYGSAPLPDCFALADAILAIPEIRDALARHEDLPDEPIGTSLDEEFRRLAIR